MNLFRRAISSFLIFILLFVQGLIYPTLNILVTPAYAQGEASYITGRFDSNQTVANVTAGTNDQTDVTTATLPNVTTSTIPAITFSGGANVVNGTIPAVTFSGGVTLVTSTIPAITFSGGADAVAATVTVTVPAALAATATDQTVNIDGISIPLGNAAQTATQVATTIVNTIQGDGGYGAKDYTVSRSGADITFTRKVGGAAGNGALTATDLSYTTTNAVAATATVTIPAALANAASDQSVTIDGVVIPLGNAAQTATQIAATIAAANFSTGTSYVANGAYTVGSAGADVTFTRTSKGASGNVGLTTADANYTTTNEVKAARTLTVGTLPVNTDTITIGSCVVTFTTTAGSTLDETNCNDNVATVDTNTGAGDTDRTTAEIATVLRSLTNVSDAAHSGLTVGGAGSDATFTTTGAETSASDITFTDGTAGNKITATSTTTGVVLVTSSIPAITFSGGVTLVTSNIPTITFASGANAIAATATSTIPAALTASASDQSVTIDGVIIPLGNSAQTATQIAATIAGTDFSSGTSYIANGAYTVSNGGTATLTFTRTAAGAAGNAGLTIGDANYTTTNGVAASVTITITDTLAANAADHSVQVDGLGAIDLGTSAQTAIQVAGTIRTGITGAGGYAGKDYTVSGTNADITFTRKATGSAGNGSLTIDDNSFTKTNAIASTATATVPAGIIANSTDHSITIDGVTIDLGTSVQTATQIAATIAGTNFSAGTSYGSNGAYTVGNVGADLTFTRTTAGAAGNNGLTIADANYGATAQVNTITIAGTVDTGDTFTVNLPTVGDVTYTVTGGDSTTANIATGLNSAIQASSGYASQAFTSAASGSTVVLTAKVAGTGFTQISSNANRAAVAQVVTFTPTLPTVGETYRATINGTNYDYTVSGGNTVATVVAALATSMDANSAVDCVNTSSTAITCTASVAGTSFTHAATVVDITAPAAPSTPDMTSGTDTGSSNTDNITSNTTPTFTGTAESSSTVRLYDTDGVTVIGTGTATGGNYSITTSVLSTGVHSITARATDAASNTSVASGSLSVTIDTTAPTIGSVSISSTNSNSNAVAKVGDTVTVSFTSSETIQTPTVTIAGNSVTASNTSGNNWRADYIMASGDSEGTVAFSIPFADLAGNTGTGSPVSVTNDSTSVTFDKTAPNTPVISSIAVDNKINIAEKTAVVIAGTAEANALVSATISDGTNTKTGTQQLTGNSTSYSITINGTTATPAALQDGTITPSVTATDLAGNTSSAATTPTATQDTVTPTLSAVQIASNRTNTAYAKVGDTVTLTFTSSESINTPTVSIATHSVTPTGGPTAWTATYTMVSGDSEGVVPFSIAFSDPSGNAGVTVTATTNSSSVTFDKTVPVISGVTLSNTTTGDGNYVKNADAVTLTATITDTNRGAMTTSDIKANLTGLNGLNNVNPNSYNTSTGLATWNLTVSATTGSVITPTVDATDESGNSATQGSVSTTFVSPTQSALEPDTSVDSTHTQIVVGTTTADSTITIPSNVNDATLDVSNLIVTSGSTDNVTLTNAIALNSSTSVGSVGIQIPAGITISGPSATWDGIINAPSVKATSSVSVPGQSGVKSTSTLAVVEVGFGDVPLTFDKSVRLLIAGKAGAFAGYARGGVVTEINNTCPSDSQAAVDATLAAGAECRIDVGADMVIWTKHFTNFVAYTKTLEQTAVVSPIATSYNTSAPVCGDRAPSGAPSFISAVAGTNSVTLNWNEAPDPVTYYLITYGEKSGAQTYGNPSIGGKGTTSYTVGGLSGGTTYFFRIRAGNGCMPGSYSGEISATPGGGFVSGPAAGFIPGVLGVSKKAQVTTQDENSPSEVKGESTAAPSPLDQFSQPVEKPSKGFFATIFGAIVGFIAHIFGK